MTKKMCKIWEHVPKRGGGLTHSQIQTWEHFVSQNVPNPKWKMCFIMTPKRPNNPPNLCDNNNIMKVTPLICSPESQNNN